MANEKTHSRRTFLRRAALGGAAVAGGGLAYLLVRRPSGPAYPLGVRETVTPLPNVPGPGPNIVLINADDLGYGDLSCYGSGAIATPHIDSLAGGGVRFTDFHACDSVCTPSRAGLLTGRYPARMMLDTPLSPGSQPLGKRALVRLGYLAGRVGLLDLATRAASRGLAREEITLAEALKAGGYRTGMVGKWHLGDFGTEPRFNPLRHGFDSFFGVPYSNDMEPFPLYRGEALLDEHIQDQSTLTSRYTEEAVRIIEDAAGEGRKAARLTGSATTEAREGDGAGRRGAAASDARTPFFLYLAHTFPHRPLFASKDFTGASGGGLYGDVVEELDWSVGRVLAALEDAGVAENTLVLFTSDNGPWYQGSPGTFRGRKGQSFEGGHRVPFLARLPGFIPPGSVCTAPAVNLDLFPTLLALAGLALPGDRIIDGADISALLAGASDASPHEFLYLYHHGELEGVRAGRWKYFRETSHYVWPMPANRKLGSLTNHTTGPLPLLFDLTTDPGEAYDLAERHPQVVDRLEGVMRAWEAGMASDPLGFGR